MLGATAAAEVRAPAASIVWEAPADCPNELEVVRQVEALLGEVWQQAKPQPLHFVAQVHPAADAGYRLLLRVAGGSDELTRELAHPRCDKLTEAASLVIALAIDPERVRAADFPAGGAEPTPGSGELLPSGDRASADSSAPSVAPATRAEAPAPHVGEPLPAPESVTPDNSITPVSATPAVPSVPPPNPASGARDSMSPGAVEPAATPPGSVGLLVSGGATAGAGVLPNVSLGAELGAGATIGEFGAVGAFVELWAPSEEPIPETSGGTLRMRQVTLGVRGCWLPELAGLRGLGCLAGEVAQLTGEGQDVTGARADSAAWAGVRAELGLLLPLRPGSYLTAGGAGGLSLRRPRFGLAAEDGTEVDVFQPSAWYVRGRVGALLTFD